MGTSSVQPCFEIGTLCILLFLLRHHTRVAVDFTYIWTATVGVTGIIFGIIPQRWYLIVLNVLPPLVFPAIMFFGTLILGP